MPTYAYQVRDKNGKKIKGFMDAVSEKRVAERLSDEGYLIAMIKPTHFLAWRRLFFGTGGKISLDELTMFYFQLSNVIEAGVPLLAALRTVMSQVEHRTLRSITFNLYSAVEGGKSFSDALSAHPKTFPELYRSMIKVGEASGTLGLALHHIAELNEAISALRHQVRSAIAYPVVLMVASVAVVVFMMVWIIPTFTMIFEKAGIPLPLPTRLLYGLGLWIKSNPFLLGAMFVAGVVGIKYVIRLPEFKYQMDRFWLSVPTLGLLIRRIEVSRWSRSVALMLSSGVPVLQTLEVTRNLMRNELFRETLYEAYVSVQGGGKLADTLQKSWAFPNDVAEMISTGEESGTLDKMLYKVANFYDQLVARTLKKATAMIEPAFILMMGGIVAFIMISVLLPIFDMIKVFRP